MTDELEFFGIRRRPDPSRPLQGMTVLVVEDSRFASEAMRLLCLRSGARIRRADSLAAAHRHLSVYRPSVVVVDLGLPDGNGTDLIAELSVTQPRVGALLATSGDPDLRDSGMAAGADDFLAKPVESLATFQQAVLAHLPPGEGPVAPRALPTELIEPDQMALRDDLAHMAEVIGQDPDEATLDYATHFLGGVALSAHDSALSGAVENLAAARAVGRGVWNDLSRVRGLLQDRLERAATV